MQVSVVIPTYNSADLVVEAVESVLAQTVPPFEVIVIDDGSTDRTRERLASYGPPVRYVHQENGGVATARNRGVKEAKGDLVAFLDADDAWHPRKLEIQLKVFQRRPELGMLGTGRLDWPNQPFPQLTEASMKEPFDVTLDDLIIRNRFLTSSILIRREVLNRVGEFDPSLHGPEDYDMWLRVAQVAPIANLPLFLTGYRNIEGSLGKRAVSMESGLRRIRGKLIAAGVFRNRPMFRASTLAFMLSTCAYVYLESGKRSRAFQLLLKSMLAYPLPFRYRDVRQHLPRVRMMRAIVLPRLRRRPAKFDDRYCPEHWTPT